MTIYELFQTIKENKSVKQRKNLLKENMNETIRYIFNDTYGSKKHGISSFMPNGNVGTLIIDNDYVEFHNVLNLLRREELKGDEGYTALQEVVANFDTSSQEILCNIINRNLKIGLSYDSFLNVIDITDARFRIAKFNEVTSEADIKTDGTYFVMNKVPGVRCICKTVRMPNNMFATSFYAENGDLITTLDNLINSFDNLTSYLGGGQFILDGIVQIDCELTGDELQQAVENAVYGTETIENPKFVIYDLMRNDEFEMRSESMDLDYRLGNIRNLIEFTKPENISVIEYTKVDSQDILKDRIQHSADCQCEGCLIRKNTIYKNNTTKDCLIYRHSK